MIVNAHSIVRHVTRIKDGIIKHVNVNVKITVNEKKKDYSWDPSTCISKNSKYLKSIVDTSVIECDEIIAVLNILSTKVTNTIARNVTSTASMNCHSKKVRDCYILHTLISDPITIDNHYHLLLLC